MKEESGKQHENAADPSGHQTVKDSPFGAHPVYHASGLGTGDDRRDVFEADDQPRENGVVAEVQMDVRRQNRQLYPEGEIAREGEKDIGKNARRQFPLGVLRDAGGGHTLSCCPVNSRACS